VNISLPFLKPPIKIEHERHPFLAALAREPWLGADLG
jgi:hypothetical protein